MKYRIEVYTNYNRENIHRVDLYLTPEHPDFRWRVYDPTTGTDVCIDTMAECGKAMVARGRTHYTVMTPMFKASNRISTCDVAEANLESYLGGIVAVVGEGDCEVVKS